MMLELFSSLVQKGDLGERGKGKEVQSSTTEQHQLRTLMGFVIIQINYFSGWQWCLNVSTTKNLK